MAEPSHDSSSPLLSRAGVFVIATIVALALLWVAASNQERGIDSTSREGLSAERQGDRRSSTSGLISGVAEAGIPEGDGGGDSEAAALVEEVAEAPAMIADARQEIPIPPEFSEIFASDPELAARHARLESEIEDPVWALRLEQYLRDLFDSSPDATALRVLSLECRSVNCEILVVGYGEDALRQWGAVAISLGEEDSRFEEIVGGPGEIGCGIGEVAAGIVSFLCHLARTQALQTEPVPAARLSVNAPHPEGVSVEPVAVADGVLEVIESNRGLYDLHRRLERETTDFSWANYSRQVIEEFLGGRGTDGGISTLSVDCRATLCEVQMMSRDESAYIRWLTDAYRFQQASTHDLVTVGMSDSGFEDEGTAGVVWILERTRGN